MALVVSLRDDKKPLLTQCVSRGSLCLFSLVQVINALLHVFVFQVFFIGGVNSVEGPVRRQFDDPVTGGVEDLVVVGSHEDGALELN